MHESPMIDLLADTDAAVYILDGMPNSFSIPSPALQDTLAKAVRQLKSRRPDTPVVLADHCGYPQGMAYKEWDHNQKHAWRALEEVYQQLLSEGVKGLYRVRYEDFGFTDEMFVEGLHMSDYGMIVYADAYEPVLRKILNQSKGELSTTVPVIQQRDRYNWMDRHNYILKTAAGKHFTRVVVGDSIMHYWGGDEITKLKRGPDSWASLPGSSLNMGCGYDRTENVLWRIQHGELDNLTADKIIIMIGTNNIPPKCTDEEIVAGIKAIIQEVQSRRPEAEVKLMGLFPRRDREDRVKTLNKSVKALANEMKVEYADPGKKLLGKDGKIVEANFTDGLHPSAQGYKLIAEDFE